MPRLLPKSFLGWRRESFNRNTSSGGEVGRQQPFHSVGAVNRTRGWYWRVLQIGVSCESPALLEFRAKRDALRANVLERLKQAAPDFICSLHHLLD
jgi:hypothetical protein